MAKYKLIKEYPGSPKIGTVLESTTDGFYQQKDVGNTHLRRESVENHSDFWQKETELEFEILTIQTNTIFGVTDSKADIDAFLASKYPHYKIHSIKRLSDGQVFTVGDSVLFEGQLMGIYKATLLEIGYEIVPGDKRTRKLTFINDNKSIGKWWTLDKISLHKKLIFVSEDNVEIFVGDKINSVYKQTLQLNCGNNTTGTIGFGFTPSKGYLYFSTTSAAEEYILMNKPCLSIKDVMDVTFEAWDEKRKALKDLKELVKKRHV